ncbi:Predicted arabinose efflux permease, MFS family [Marininema mesophilum]|uniref:Predicted arabinose efflux permease, MFS family n=1 Tax=Marininema mesophilum TaxID=1048340 RepID=A0A1H2WIM4_9BACL|nr:MFS transporter [Marininema mesophilum]SDW80405.1 Predicted arabinose efflux permease, MFS family [Marininema mesophilum]
MRLRDWDQNLKARLYGEGLINILYWMFFPFMAVYFSDAFGKEVAGILLVVSQLLGVLANLIGGRCADRFGRKRIMLISTIGEALCFLLFAFANSPWFDSPVLSFICFAGLGIFNMLYYPASDAMIADLVEPKHRNEVFAVFHTAASMAIVIGPILGGFLFFSHFFALLLASAGASFLLAAMIAWYVRETAVSHSLAKGESVDKRQWKQMIVDQLKDYGVIVKDRNFMLFIIAGILIAQTFIQLDLAVAVYVTQAIPVQKLFSLGIWSVYTGGATFFGWLIALNGILVVLFTVWVNRWVSQFPVGRIFIVSSLMYGVSMLIFGSSTALWVAIAAVVFLTIAELLVIGLQESFVSELSPKHMRGQYFAASSLRYSIGRTFAPMAIPLADWVGYFWMFFILGGIAFTGAWVYHILFRRLKQETG